MEQVYQISAKSDTSDTFWSLWSRFWARNQKLGPTAPKVKILKKDKNNPWTITQGTSVPNFNQIRYIFVSLG